MSMFQVRAVALVALVFAGEAGATRYHVEKLDPGSPGVLMTPGGVDSEGRVVGNVNLRAVVYDTPSAPPTFLPSLGGSSFADATNGQGLIVGASYPARGPHVLHAVSWQDGVVTDLGGLPTQDGSPPSGAAEAVNGPGDIVGYSMVKRHVEHAFLVHEGVMRDLGSLKGGHGSSAHGINDLGHAVGMCTAGDYSSHACKWRDGRVFDLASRDGVTLSSQAVAINNHDEAVGSGYLSTLPAGMSTALRWHNGKQVVLGSLETRAGYRTNAWGINDDGVVVGDSMVAGRQVAFVVPAGGAMTALDTLLDDSSLAAGWSLMAATAINAAGDIVGVATLAGANGVAYVARPVP